MSHSTAIRELADYASGRLEPADRSRIEEHLEGCTECASWLTTYRLLASTLESSTHPPSEQLALCAVAPGDLHEEDRQRILTHLDACPPCRREFELTRAATDEAREVPRRWRPLPAQGRLLPMSPKRLAIAAGVLLVLITGTAIVYNLSFRVNNTGFPARTLHGSQLLEAEKEILVGATEIAAGAEVTIRAADVVALGEGFSMAAGATLTVEVETSAPEL